MKTVQSVFHIGTSGWNYPHWVGVFYPVKTPKARWFEYYATQFTTVEVNATFYRRFQDSTYEKWRSRAPKSFRYVLKAPKIITHRKYLVGANEEISEFSRSASLLQDRFGLILLQLAPITPYEPERLRNALCAFPQPECVAVEFRHARWLTEETRSLLSELRAPFCAVDSPRMKLLDWVTSDTGYIRLHGRKKWYSHNYSRGELKEVAGLAQSMRKGGAAQVYIFFNNDFDGHAPRNAQTLMELL